MSAELLSAAEYERRSLQQQQQAAHLTMTDRSGSTSRLSFDQRVAYAQMLCTSAQGWATLALVAQGREEKE